MTPVEFRFITPEGVPVAAARVEIQLSRASFNEEDTGVLMPRLVEAVTDSLGEVTVELWPNPTLYIVTVEDTNSDAVLSYKFFVPETVGNTSVRLQDIIVDGTISNTHYDEAALLIIHDAKSAAIAARLAAEAAAAQVSTQASQATTKASEAAASAASALASKNQASNSEATATDAAVVASASASAANTKAIEATDSATSAQTAKTGAENALVSATAQATAAATSNTAASGHKDAAAISAAASEASKVAADGFRTAAQTAATNSSNSAGASSTSAEAAAASATTAGTQAGISTTKASESAASAVASEASRVASDVSATAANASKVAAETARTDATAQAAASGVSATAASTARTGAETALGSATTQAGNAAASATAASGSASAANTSRIAAQSAQAAAEAARDEAVAIVGPSVTLGNAAGAADAVGGSAGVATTAARADHAHPTITDAANTWTGVQTYSDSTFKLKDNSDATKVAFFELSAITTGTQHTYTLPNVTGTLATLGNLSQTFTGATTFSAATTVSGALTVSGLPTFSNATLNLGSATAASTVNIAYGANASGITKTVNIGTAGASGSTTNINLGSAVLGANVAIASRGTWTHTGNAAFSGTVTGVTKAMVGLSDVDNTSDANKPLSTAATTALAGKEASITAGAGGQYWRWDKSWQDFATDVRAAVLTGLSTATNAAVVAGDTVLAAFGKLQAQITAHFGSGGGAHADATTVVAGFMPAADKIKLNGISAGATANDTDANLKSRANHTGSQAISTVTGLQTALDTKVTVGAVDTDPIITVAASDVAVNTGNYFKRTISAPTTLTFSGTPSGVHAYFVLALVVTAGSITWPASVRWPRGGTTPTFGVGRHRIWFETDDGGATWFGSFIENYPAA